MLSIAEITRDLFGELEERGIKYCVYNGYESLPDRIEGDLDIAIEKRAFRILPELLNSIARRYGAVLLYKIWHDAGKIAYMISPLTLDKPERLQLDFFYEFSIRDYSRKNSPFRYLLMDEAELLERMDRADYYFVPPPEKEFILKLLRRIFKKDFPREKLLKVFELYKRNPEGTQQLLRNYFPRSHQKILLHLQKQDLTWFENHRNHLLKELKRFKWRYLRPARILKNIHRTLHRIFRPVGFTVAFLGPDGSGKSTLARQTLELFSKTFHGQKLFYWRPGLLKEPGVAFGLRKEIRSDNPDPHGHPREHPIKSLFRFLYYLLDFTLGYWVKVWPLKVKKYLCVFDRYYYDVVVDPFRYNFSLPHWLLKIPLKIVPKPDLTFIIDVEPEIALSRKKELPLQELRRQREEFRRLKQIFPSSFHIVKNQNLQNCLEEISRFIIEKKKS